MRPCSPRPLTDPVAAQRLIARAVQEDSFVLRLATGIAPGPRVPVETW